MLHYTAFINILVYCILFMVAMVTSRKGYRRNRKFKVIPCKIQKLLNAIRQGLASYFPDKRTTNKQIREHFSFIIYSTRSGMVWCCRSLLGTVWQVMSLYVSTGDGVVGSGAVYLYWGRCGRQPHCRSLLETDW